MSYRENSTRTMWLRRNLISGAKGERVKGIGRIISILVVFSLPAALCSAGEDHFAQGGRLSFGRVYSHDPSMRRAVPVKRLFLPFRS